MELANEKIQPVRIRYLDVLKGILIAFVVLEHIHYTTTNLCGFANVGQSWKLFNGIEKFAFVPFYMPCFFLVTGLCGNFNKDFSTFVKKNILTLLWPSFVITLSGLWFVWAMFFSKIFYWVVNKYISSAKIKWILLVLMSVAGSAIDDSPLGVFFQKWYLAHALGLCIFIHLGVCMKSYTSKKVYFIMALLAYVIVATACYAHNIQLPSLCFKYKVALMEVPLHLFLAVSGSLGLLIIAKMIKYNCVLEYLGKNSLVVFLTHVVVMKAVIFHVPGIRENLHLGCVYWIVFAVTILICCLIAYVFNMKYLRWLLGKLD